MKTKKEKRDSKERGNGTTYSDNEKKRDLSPNSQKRTSQEKRRRDETYDERNKVRREDGQPNGRESDYRYDNFRVRERTPERSYMRSNYPDTYVPSDPYYVRSSDPRYEIPPPVQYYRSPPRGRTPPIDGYRGSYYGRDGHYDPHYSERYHQPPSSTYNQRAPSPGAYPPSIPGPPDMLPRSTKNPNDVPNYSHPRDDYYSNPLPPSSFSGPPPGEPLPHEPGYPSRRSSNSGYISSDQPTYSRNYYPRSLSPVPPYNRDDIPPSHGSYPPSSPSHYPPRNRSPSPRSDSRRGDRSYRSPPSSPTRFYKTKLCKFFSKGGCKDGRNCKFAHGEKEIR